MADSVQTRSNDVVKSLETNLPVLKRGNWDIWKFKITLLLKAKGWISAIESENVASEISQIVYSHLVNLCDEDNVKLIMQSGTAYKAWQKLAQVHENKTPQEKHQLYRSLFTMKIKTVSEEQTKVAELQNMAAQLRSLGEIVSDVLLMSVVMEALPTEYKAFLAFWKTQDDQSFERFLKHLDNHTIELLMETKVTDDVALNI